MRGQNKMGKRAYTISETFISDTLQERERNLEKLAAEYFRILEKRLVHTALEYSGCNERQGER